jgi:hypothetical protein
MQPGVYFTSERRPASRYIWTGPVLFNLLTHPDFQLPAVIRELEATPARLIVLERNYRDSQLGVRVESAFESPAMQRLLDRYDKVAEVEDFVVFRRRDGSHDR